MKVIKLNEELKENSLISQIKIRMALHSDIGYSLGDSIQGPVLNNLERILSMGSAGDILLLEYMVAIIKSISKKYNECLNYAGIYPKKKGGTEKIWYYYCKDKNKLNEDEKIGNIEKPRKERKSLIFYTSKKNRILAVFLIIFSLSCVIISSLLFLNKPFIDYKIDNIRPVLQREIAQIL